MVPAVAQERPKLLEATVSSTNAAAAPATPVVASNAAVKSPAANVYASPWMDEVERLTKAGVDEGVVLAYVINTAGTFNLTADQIIHLKNLGVSPQVINAMLQHDQELASGARPMTAPPPPSLPTSFKTALTFPPAPAAVVTASPATPGAPPPGPTPIIAPDDSPPEWIYVEPDDVPDQPASAGPVRVPYPVKLNDPIIILRLPSFSVPCW
jgi:hypothetical protein